MNIARKSLINKACAILLILLLTISDFAFVGTAAISYAIDVVKTNHTNVDFSAYFINSQGEKVEKLEQKIDKSDEYLYVEISVHNDGYFNGAIHLNNSNFNIKQEKLSSEIAEISGNEVKLNQINAGNTATIKLAIEPIKEDTIAITTLDTKTEVQLTGQYINSQNVETDKHIEINGTANVEMSWKSSDEIKAELESEILTNKLYEVNGETQRIVQILVNSKITNNNYPTKSTQIELDVPENVQEVKVHARSTAATNKNIEFNNENYTYDETNKKLTIKLENEESNNISWNKGVQDTLIITYIFNKEENISNKNITIQSTINTYDDKQLTNSKNVHIENEIDGIISHSIEMSENAIYKGKIYTKEDRDYTITNKLYIDYINVENSIDMSYQDATYLAKEQEMSANIIYKQTKIDKSEFLKLFGEEGFITVKDSSGKTIANINKDSKTDDNGKITINYTGETKSINITTSKPIEVGTLNIQTTKTILDAGYGRDIIDTLTAIQEKATIKNIQTTKTMELKNTETTASLKMDVNTISTIAESQEITLEATLISNDESKDLYKNPKVTITFPKEMKITSAQYATLYNNGLQVQDCTTTQNENGQYKIEMQLIGEQTKYDSIGETKIYLKISAKTEKLTPTKTSLIEMAYTNENKNISNTTNAEIKFESQYGLMLYNQIENYNNSGETIVTIDSQPAEGSLDANAESKEASIGTAIINNYGQPMFNVVLIGTVPSNDNSTFKATINNVQTDMANAKISYSNNVNALPDDSSWGEYTQDAVAYKIEIPEMQSEQIIKVRTLVTIPEKLDKNETGKFETKTYCQYQNQEQTNSSTITLATPIDETQPQIQTLSVQETQSGLRTEISAIIGNASISEEDKLYEGQTIKYQISITNNTGNDYTNVNISANQKNGYVWDLVETEETNPWLETTSIGYFYKITESNDIKLATIEQLKNGETYTYEYETTVYRLDNEAIDGNTTYGTISITSEDNQLKDTVETIKNQIIESQITANISKTYSTERELNNDGNTPGLLTITNTADKTLTDMELNFVFPSDINITLALDADYRSRLSYENEETTESGLKIKTFKISELAANETMLVELELYTENLKDSEKTLWVYSQINLADGQSYRTNKMERTIYNKSLDIATTQQAYHADGSAIDLDNEKLNDGDTVKIVTTITNNHESDYNIDYIYNIDEMINIEEAIITSNISGEENVLEQLEYNQLTRTEQSIASGETITITITGKVDATGIESIKTTLSIMDNIVGNYNESTLSILVNKLDVPEEPKPLDEEEDEDLPIEGEVAEQGSPENDPEEPDPEEDPETEDPETEDPETEDPETEDPNTEDPETEDPNTEDPNTEDPNTENPETPTNGDEGEGQGNQNGQTQTETPINRYTISGIAWLDIDKDGIRESSEETMEDIKVEAMNLETGEIIATTTTNMNGEYEFNILEGNYIIIFYYDNNIYTTTTYRVNGENDSETSDAIGREISINGTTQTVGTTDEITLDKDLENIDIGLIQRQTFDLKIEKYVSKITVQNDAGTKTYEQDDEETLAKAEIRAKNLERITCCN